MTAKMTSYLSAWTMYVPILAVAALALTWGADLPPPLVVISGLLLAGAVLAAVHHAEVVAHKVGEPFGSLVLAVAVTIIEVALIVTLMISGGEKTQSLARDTVFAAVMITCNGILGISLLVGAIRRRIAVFNPEGTGGALAAVATIATLSLVLPSFTTSRPGPQFSPAQLGFAAVASLALYLLFVLVQTRRHRDYFMPITTAGDVIEGEDHLEPPTKKATLTSLGLLLVALIAVVGLAKVESPSIESGVEAAGFPAASVGVVIALLVLLPESIAAIRAAALDNAQTSMNLAYGSAMASIGLTIPTIAVASIFIDDPLRLGLEPMQMVLLAITAVVSVLTVVPGRAKPLQGGVHLVLLASFVFLSLKP